MNLQILIKALPLLLVMTATQAETSLLVERECKRIAGKLASVGYRECLDRQLTVSDGHSVEQAPILVRDYPANHTNGRRILLVGGIHGDEYATVTIVFKWLALLDRYHTGRNYWRIVPLLNPDGLLQAKSQRLNSHGMDLELGFPVAGETTATSSPEVQWLADDIRSFHPDVIVVLHAPHEIVDYATLEEGQYKLQRLTMTTANLADGSLSQFAESNGIPLLSVELPYADIMPTTAEIVTIWQDVQDWINTRLADSR